MIHHQNQMTKFKKYTGPAFADSLLLDAAD
jgi:hypothetical protein